MKAPFSAEDARAFYAYDKDTGVLTRVVNASRAKAGDRPGWLSDQGYYRVCVLGHNVLAHRLAWLLHYGEWPPIYIDHINGDRCDNRISNLRLATHSQNQCNQAKQSRRTTSRHKGVCWHKNAGKWMASIKINRRAHYLGLFVSEDDAHRAYCEASERLHGQYGRAA